MPETALQQPSRVNAPHLPGEGSVADLLKRASAGAVSPRTRAPFRAPPLEERRKALAALVTHHRSLDRALLEEYKHPYPDNQRIQSLKRAKLHTKDRIQALQDEPPLHTD